jgi:hypothetical protein
LKLTEAEKARLDAPLSIVELDNQWKNVTPPWHLEQLAMLSSKNIGIFLESPYCDMPLIAMNTIG